jgi:hypothetical protein
MTKRGDAGPVALADDWKKKDGGAVGGTEESVIRSTPAQLLALGTLS